MGLSFLSKFVQLIVTTVSSKNEVMTSACKFLVNLPYGLAWITVAMYEMLLLVATWICWISRK